MMSAILFIWSTNGIHWRKKSAQSKIVQEQTGFHSLRLLTAIKIRFLQCLLKQFQINQILNSDSFHQKSMTLF